MTREYYPGWPKILDHYTRVCRYCNTTYYVEERHPHAATHNPYECEKRPKEKEEPVEVSLTPTQAEALRTVNSMATHYLAGNCGSLPELEVDKMDDAIDVAGKLIEDLNSGRVKLVNLQE